MKQFQILRYLKKYQIFIALGSIIAGFLFYTVAQSRLQSYTAAAVIEYTNTTAEEGKAPDDTEIDPQELKSSHIVSRALENLGIDIADVNLDGIRGNLQISEIISQEEQQSMDAKIELGEDYEIKPTKYLISFSSGVEGGKEYPRRILNEILDVYTSWYGETHVNLESGANSVNDIYSKNYDYIEMMEMVSETLESTLALLSTKMENDPTFRSYNTGYAFNDLYNEFYLLRYVEAPQISADILHRTITKDRDVLLAKYQNRNNSLSINNQVTSAETDKILEIIDSYVEMMSSSDNTNITSEYILQELQENYGYDSEGNVLQGTDQTTEYDKLLEGYVENRTLYEENVIDTAYNKYVISVFSGANEHSSDEVLAETEKKIKTFVEKINSFYEILDQTNDEYNEFLGAKNIAVLSSVGVSEKMPVRTFTIFVVLIFGVVGCAGAIFLGRIGDIIDYYAFTNKVDGLPNRAKCDRFIAEQERSLLTGHYTCIALKMTNLQEENRRLGRQTGDSMMRTFAGVLTSVFPPSDKLFIGYNGAGQYLLFAQDMNGEQARTALEQMEAVLEQANEENAYTIKVQSGYAEAAEERCYYIRKLISLAMRRLNGAPSPEKTAEKTEKAEKMEKSSSGGSYFEMNEDYYEKFLQQKRGKK